MYSEIAINLLRAPGQGLTLIAIRMSFAVVVPACRVIRRLAKHRDVMGYRGAPGQ